MKFNLEINNQTKSPIKKAFFDEAFKLAFADKSVGILSAKIINLSLALVSRAEIKKINRIWRKKNEVTDILSFAEFNNLEAIRASREKEIFLGEIILCYDDIKAYAKQKGSPINQELVLVFLHGILHLLGFRHGKIMFALQNKLLIKFHPVKTY